MKAVHRMGMLILLILLAGCDQTGRNTDKPALGAISGAVLLENDDFIQTFLGEWTFRDDDEYFMEMIDGDMIVGIYNADLLSRGTYEIVEMNRDEQYIVTHGYDTYLDYGDSGQQEQEEYRSKLILLNGGSELLYVKDYLTDAKESYWMKDKQ